MSHEAALRPLMETFHKGDADALRQMLQRHPELRQHINAPIGPFNSPPILHAGTPEMLDALLDAGADINARSTWWAGGFGLLHTAPIEVCRHAIERGATVDAHAAARLGMVDTLRELLKADPQLVHARGGDGQTPLHFASTTEIAGLLLDAGADIDALDVDHVSTPAQYMVRDRQEVARYLVGRGCRTDLLMLSALGDMARVKALLDADPDAIRMRVSDEWFPTVGDRCGGTIYQWTLGWYVSAHQVAKQFGQAEILELLMQRSPPAVRLVAACWLGDQSAAGAVIASHPEVVASFSAEDRRQLAHAARNNDSKAFDCMMTARFPLDGRGQHRGSALHWAAWHGNLAMVEALLRRSAPLEAKDNDFNATPLGWAIHGSENGWQREKGSYGGVVTALLRAGAVRPAEISGTPEVRAALAVGN